MMYDVPPADLNAPNGFNMETYKFIFGTFEANVEKHQIVMGFEPGAQASKWKWEGMDTDKSIIDYVQSQNYGGVMFWAIN